MAGTGENDGAKRVPSWNGNVGTWNRYETDCAWYSSSLALDKRQFVVGRLVNVLRENSALRILVQQWQPVQFEATDGVQRFLQRLRAS